jgi:hypothetical protein
MPHEKADATDLTRLHKLPLPLLPFDIDRTGGTQAAFGFDVPGEKPAACGRATSKSGRRATDFERGEFVVVGTACYRGFV